MFKTSRALVRQGDAARDARDWAAARLAYREALRCNPKLAHIWVQFGHALNEGGFHSEALGAYFTADVLRPGVADTLLQIGRMQRLLGQHAPAMASYDRALALDPLLASAAEEQRQLRTQLEQRQFRTQFQPG